MRHLLFLSVLLNLTLLTSAVSAAESNQIDMDDVKIRLVVKGDLTVKKIAAPDKALLQKLSRLKLANKLKSSQKSPELLRPENLEIVELSDTLLSTIPGDRDLPEPRGCKYLHFPQRSQFGI